MRYLALLLLISVSSLASAQNVYEQASRLIADGSKRQAWSLLYPRAVNESDTKAMMMLGQMLLNSPEIADNEEKALRMFQAAERQGHRGASTFVDIAKSHDQFSRQAERRVQNAKTFYAQAEREHKRLQRLLEDGFLDGDGNVYAAQVDVFIDGDSVLPLEVERLTSARAELRENVLVYHHLVFDESQIGNANPFTSNFKPPAQGLEPDINGDLARKLGVSRFPAIVLRTQDDRAPRVITLSQLTNWAKQWRKP